MNLPTPAERQAIIAERERKQREYEAAEQRKADEAAAEKLRKREETIVQLLSGVEGYVTRALEYGKDHAYVRIADGRNWTDEFTIIANEVCQRAKLAAPEYDFTPGIEEWCYKDHETDGDGYPSGKEYWVEKHWLAVKVTWPEPIVAELAEPERTSEEWTEIFREIAAENEAMFPKSIKYKVELANFDSGLPDEFKTEFDSPPTKEMILTAIDRLRQVFDDHYVPGPQPEPGCCGTETNIVYADQIRQFIKITALGEDEE